MDPFDALHALRAFRRSLYECLHRRGDALFELADAILTADGGGVPSPVHLTASEHRIVVAGAASTPRSGADESTPKPCGGCSPTIHSPEAERPSTPWT